MQYKVSAVQPPKALPRVEDGVVYLFSNEAWPRDWVKTLLQAPILSRPICYTGTSAFRNIDLLSVISLIQLAKRLVQLYPNIQQEAQTYRWERPKDIIKNAKRMSLFLERVSREKDVSKQLKFIENLADENNLSPLPPISATVVDWNPKVLLFWLQAKEKLFFKSPISDTSSAKESTKAFKQRFARFYRETFALYFTKEMIATSTQLHKRREISTFGSEAVHDPSRFLFLQSPLLLHFGVQQGCELSAVQDNLCTYAPPVTDKETLRIAYVSNVHDHLSNSNITTLLKNLQDSVEPDIIIASRRQNPKQGTTDPTDHPSKVFSLESGDPKPVIALRNFICEVR